jgi:AhpD family alkylhydroperoxidase
MFDEIGEIRSARKKYNGLMFESTSPVFKGFEELEATALRSGTLDRKYKELIALSISVCENCYGCIEYHVGAALESGATREEIVEATAVSICLGGGPSTWPARFVFKVLDEFEGSRKRNK